MGARGPSATYPLTAREHQVASLVGLGLTNRQIAGQLGVSDRTVGAHVQNILNKLGASNRAQIAAWAARDAMLSSEAPTARSVLDAHVEAVAASPAATGAPAASLAAHRFRSARARSRVALLTAIAIVAALGIFDHVVSPGSGAATQLPKQRGALAFQAQLEGGGAGFTDRWVIGDPGSSTIRFVSGAVQYSAVKPDGKTGNGLTIAPLAGYIAEVELAADPGSAVMFWFDFAQGNSLNPVSQHLIYIDTKAQLMRLAYFIEGRVIEFLGPWVPINGLDTGRHFKISALIDPPQYRVALDGTTVINLRHEPSPPRQTPSFAIFGQGTGTVRITALSIYGLA